MPLLKKNLIHEYAFRFSKALDQIPHQMDYFPVANNKTELLDLSPSSTSKQAMWACISPLNPSRHISS